MRSPKFLKIMKTLNSNLNITINVNITILNIKLIFSTFKVTKSLLNFIDI